MANFDIAYAPTAKIEGGYANNPNDTGKETVFGLTRRDWPNWSGWHVVDHLKEQLGLAKAIPLINKNKQLKDSVKLLFKSNYWDSLNLDSITNQQIADQAFDAAINMGVDTSAKFLQECAGVPVDFHIGPKTIIAINSSKTEEFYNKFLQLRRDRYEKIIAANPKQAQFKESWFSRLTPFKQA